ncbi:MAG: hypothetical protein V7605_2575 [Acidimicrobiaceae bacterium]|jgi:hypothetical protein
MPGPILSLAPAVVVAGLLAVVARRRASQRPVLVPLPVRARRRG